MEDNEVKITKIVLGVLAAVSLGAAIAMDSNGDDKVFAIGSVPEMILVPVFAVLVPLLLLVICILSLAGKVGYGERGKGLCIAGIIIFGISTAFVSYVTIDNKKDLVTIKKLKSPDGEHMIYYYDADLSNDFTDTKIPGIVTLRRTGFFTYEKSICCTDNEKDRIIWEDDGYTSFIGKEKSKYSSYGD